ncbi:pseudaminic acid biosynthesis-associated methylase [Shewanella psychrotolerans]|uniref:pseudaminic acid biosynthesis-associated methylase n=1 Tax=Shewanella psychrotolerans TaxID=2864206 RepID=UPI001C65CA51|nr:pseudaminic acid biosynthesis-associated methylase [Shewanella psychrotolerans]QYK00362.1 pseudaminic acid biosynthesis-associated methylase [Shewanella psychrotolerans]
MKFKTEQEAFWAGEFGNNYIERNKSDTIVAANIAMLSAILKRTQNVQKIIEFGSNIGLNLEALKVLVPNAALSAIEINDNAVKKLARFSDLTVHHTSILEFIPKEQHDLALIKGVLIHINPDELDHVYQLLYQSSSRYICLSEYYNPTPVEVNYRGHQSRLFKRDFAGEMLDKYPDLKLVDYGFVYHRDNRFPQDDMTWFLLEKIS